MLLRTARHGGSEAENLRNLAFGPSPFCRGHVPEALSDVCLNPSPIGAAALNRFLAEISQSHR
jgi:hypothetical protein